MKLSEAIDRLQAGDTVWVKGTFDLRLIDTEEIRLEFSDECSGLWLNGEQEISLTEPQAEKVEVPDFVAVWYESNKHKLERAIIDVACSMEKGEFPYNLPFEDWFIDPENHPIETLIRMKDGYTVKPKRWVVKSKDHISLESFINGTVNPMWTTEEPLWMTFTDKSKAEAVATLVEGSVEEV